MSVEKEPEMKVEEESKNIDMVLSCLLRLECPQYFYLFSNKKGVPERVVTEENKPSTDCSPCSHLIENGTKSIVCCNHQVGDNRFLKTFETDLVSALLWMAQLKGQITLFRLKKTETSPEFHFLLDDKMLEYDIEMICPTQIRRNEEAMQGMSNLYGIEILYKKIPESFTIFCHKDEDVRNKLLAAIVNRYKEKYASEKTMFQASQFTTQLQRIFSSLSDGLPKTEKTG